LTQPQLPAFHNNNEKWASPRIVNSHTSPVSHKVETEGIDVDKIRDANYAIARDVSFRALHPCKAKK